MESVRSLGYRTSLSLLQQAGSTVVEHDDHVVISTAENPDFWWGNFLLLRERPSAERAPEWAARFEEVLPWAKHRAFGLDDPDTPADAFVAFADLGYQVDRNTVMTTRSVPSTAHPAPGRHLSATAR